MAVAFGTVKSATPATGSTFTSSSWTISGSNLVIVISIGLQTSNATVTGVSWSLGSGTAAQIKHTQTANGTAIDCAHDVWAIPAPVAGSGTFTVNLSASVPYQITADYFTGADQTTPCPVADAMTIQIDSYSGSGAFTFNPTNVGANDGVYASMSHTAAGDSNGWTTGTSDFEDKTTAVNTTAAHNLGAAVTCVAAALINTPTTARIGGVGVRIQEQAAAAGAPDPVAFMVHNRFGPF